MKNRLTYGTYISLFLTNLYFIPIIKQVFLSFVDYLSNIGILNALNKFINFINNDVVFKPDIQITNGNITIKNLSFGYTSKKLFNNVNLEINENEKIAIIGESGNGKSTLIKIIMGYIPISDNVIFIDNQDINKHNLTSIRKNITYINQQIKLFNNTIYYNIQYGNNLTINEIDDFITMFNLDDIFINLPDKLNSHVGANGDLLSGGQKQIINILRGFGSNNKIIILDEPTSALDDLHRDIVMNMITKLGKESTLIIITHDKHNLNIVSKSFQINNGNVINI